MDRIENTDILKGKIEAILFSFAEPLSEKKLSKILNLSISELKFLLGDLQFDYQKSSRGIHIYETDGYVQLGTKKEHYEIIASLNEKTKTKGLSQSALEVLAIIAYKQPITKAEIEQIRGVSPDGIIATLMQRELIYVSDKLEKIGRPSLYSTTREFLRVFGLSNLSDLPKLEQPIYDNFIGQNND